MGRRHETARPLQFDFYLLSSDPAASPGAGRAEAGGNGAVAAAELFGVDSSGSLAGKSLATSQSFTIDGVAEAAVDAMDFRLFLRAADGRLTSASKELRL